MPRHHVKEWSGEWGLGLLVKMRWVASASIFAILVLLQLQPMAATMPMRPLWLVALAMVASNALLAWRLRKLLSPDRLNRLIGPTLLWDVIALTILLGFAGGPSNPFSVLYLVHVTLAALMLRGAWLWGIVAASILGYGALFWWHVPLPPELGGHGMHHGAPQPAIAPEHQHHQHHQTPAAKEPEQAFSAHLQGMWIALSLVATFIAYFVSKLNVALDRERAARASVAKQLSLTTLAAGAAHELATPLSTIKLAAAELKDNIEQLGPEHGELLEDTTLIVSEVNRARQVLDRMALGAGELAGEGVRATTIAQVIARSLEGLGAQAARVQVQELPALTVLWPFEATAQALTQLMKNALEASTAPVFVSVQRASARVVIKIVDHGDGMSAEVLARLGEPFFTTKATGEGMGLGVFLAHTLMEQLGGSLQAESAQGQGTTMIIELPAEMR